MKNLDEAKKASVSNKRAKVMVSDDPPDSIAIPAPTPAAPAYVPGSNKYFEQFWLFKVLQVTFPGKEPGLPNLQDDAPELYEDKSRYHELKQQAEQFFQYWSQHRVPEITKEVEKSLPRHRPIYDLHTQYIRRFFCMLFEPYATRGALKNAKNVWSDDHVAHGGTCEFTIVPYLTEQQKRNGFLETDLPAPVVFYVNQYQATYLRALHVAYFLNAYVKKTVVDFVGRHREEMRQLRMSQIVDFATRKLVEVDAYHSLKSIVETFDFTEELKK